jgi:hypothetical protein
MRPVHLAGGSCWFILREKYCWLLVCSERKVIKYVCICAVKYEQGDVSFDNSCFDISSCGLSMCASVLSN